MKSVYVISRWVFDKDENDWDACRIHGIYDSKKSADKAFEKLKHFDGEDSVKYVEENYTISKFELNKRVRF